MSDEILDFLNRRRSVKKLIEPGPDRAQIEQILRIAARVPDHGKLCPWYFIVFEGEARRQIGALLEEAWAAREPDASQAKLEIEGERFLRSPVIIAVVSKIKESKHAAWEQIMSAGAACMNMCLAANAMGFGTNWLSQWYATDPVFRKGLGIGENENIAGFIHIGSIGEQPDERERPELETISTHWHPGATLNKGEIHAQTGLGLPKAGFRLTLDSSEK